MHLLLAAAVLVSISTNIFSQFNPGAKQVSLSNSDAALSNDVFALFNNPAGLSQMNWREGGIYYSPSPFGFKEMANAFFAYNEPLGFGSAAIGGMTYGFELYKETKILAGISYNYLNKFFAGAVVNFHTVSINNYGNSSAFYINIGGLAYLTDFVRLGFSLHNINRASFTDEEDLIPVTFNSGFSVDIINQLSINFSVEKETRYDALFHAGIDYSIIDNISLRTGFSSETGNYTAGIGINYLFINLDYALLSHPDLGLTHQAGLIFSFGEDGNRNEKIKKHLNISR